MKRVTAHSIAIAFARLVSEAKDAGFSVVADSDSVAIRIVSGKQARDGADLRNLGEVVKVHDACGGGGSTSSGDACNYGNR